MLMPFSEKARQAAQSSEFTIDDFLLQATVEFIESVLTNQRLDVSASDICDVKKLALAKVVLSLCPYHLIARFSDNYAKLWRRYFRDHQEAAAQFGREVFPTLSSGEWHIVNVFDYLAAEESISLANVSNGTVHLSNSELNDVLARQVKRRVLVVPSSPNVPEEVKRVAIELSKRFALPVAKQAKFLEREEIKKIRLGLPEGERYYGCMKLARACFRDELSLEQAKQVIMEFVKACPPSRNPFTDREAYTCLEWVYRKGLKVNA